MTESILNATEATERAPQWHYIQGKLWLALEFDGFAEAVVFVNTVAALASERDHHPDVDLRYNQVRLSTVSHDVGGITERDIYLANAITAAAETTETTARPELLTVSEIAIDTMDADAIRPFWAAILGAKDRNGEVVGPQGAMPTVWFQQLDEPRPVRNRIHLDVAVAHDEAPRRLDAALAAGGRLISDEMAPSFWILADADGNEACLCTWQDPAPAPTSTRTLQS